MAWTAVYETATGRLVSVGDRVAAPLPSGMSSAPVGATRPDDSVMWDTTSRAFVARPAKVLIDRVQELRNDATLAVVWSRLTAAQQTLLQNRLATLLGPRRFRSASDTTDLRDR